MDGGFVGIVTSDDETEQSFLVAIMKDRSQGDCAVVLKGVVFSASNETTLTGALGIIEDFANKHDGYVLCPIF